VPATVAVKRTVSPGTIAAEGGSIVISTPAEDSLTRTVADADLVPSALLAATT